MKKLIIATVGMFVSFTVSAADHGLRNVRLEVAQGTADQIFAGNGDKVDISKVLGAGVERNAMTTMIQAEYGLSQDSQVDYHVTYMNVDAGSGDPTNGGKENIGGIAELGARYMKDCTMADFAISYGFGVRTQGDNRGGAAFSSLSDGFTKYDYYLGAGYDIGMVNLNLSGRYTDRASSEAKPQTLLGLTASVMAMDDLQISASYQNFKTQGGKDLLDTGFSFATVKEEFTAMVLAAGYKLNEQYVIDASYGSKTDGKNSDVNKTMALGVTYLY